MSRRTYLTALGDVNDPGTWSGIPYHFLQAARAGNLIDEGIRLESESSIWRNRRLLWNGWRFLTWRGKGGFQYSVSGLEALWQPHQQQLVDQIVINCYQLFAPSMVANPRIRKIFYVDMTLKQLFDFYQMRETVGVAIAREAIAREQEGYRAAEWVVGHSQWAADSVIADYGIDRSKVRAIVPGANIDRAVYQDWYQKQTMKTRNSNQPMQLIFVGKYWDRKGLDRLLEAVLQVQRLGHCIGLTVLGCRQEDLPQHLQQVPGVNWLGFINKKTEMMRFLEIMNGAEIGCLLSRAEAGGMVLREYHALGLVVMGTAVGGSPEHMFADAGYAFSPEATPQEIAAWLVSLIQHPEKLASLKLRAWERRQEATWDHTVSQWRTLLA